ncbi:hypothetical protein J2Z21_009373 [Streptomyces griseochromogenes]|uniref:Uncharacterized protein n=1 Tax=Streptomyces griseochromogenes TaxID=68214 RepID=A0ABS4M9K0_9ACTN|nr:hypothetical protein [Streptomyces griseochromogenes]MBP2056355.1 hypothetical protein [Streptomyces griseochromogenes]
MTRKGGNRRKKSAHRRRESNGRAYADAFRYPDRAQPAPPASQAEKVPATLIRVAHRGGQWAVTVGGREGERHVLHLDAYGDHGNLDLDRRLDALGWQAAEPLRLDGRPLPDEFTVTVSRSRPYAWIRRRALAESALAVVDRTLHW